MIDTRTGTSPLFHLFSSTCASGATVALFGEVLADVFPDRTVLGGAPFNVARHLRAFGLNPVLITRTGNDALREQLLGAMSRYGMETLGVQLDPVYPTGQVRVHLEDGGHRFEILDKQAYDFIHTAVARMSGLGIHPALVYFGTLAQRHETSRRALRALLARTDAPTFLDVNLRAPWYETQTIRRSLQHADIVKLNADELTELAGLFALAGDTPEGQARAMMQKFGIAAILTTCGAEGAWLVETERAAIRVAAQAENITLVDTVGAGDGFAAVFILGMLRRWKLPLTLGRAHAFAGSICGIRGAIPEHDDFYQPFIKEWNR